jgi:hypothetical protein
MLTHPPTLVNSPDHRYTPVPAFISCHVVLPSNDLRLQAMRSSRPSLPFTLIASLQAITSPLSYLPFLTYQRTPSSRTHTTTLVPGHLPVPLSRSRSRFTTGVACVRRFTLLPRSSAKEMWWLYPTCTPSWWKPFRKVPSQFFRRGSGPIRERGPPRIVSDASMASSLRLLNIDRPPLRPSFQHGRSPSSVLSVLPTYQPTAPSTATASTPASVGRPRTRSSFGFRHPLRTRRLPCLVFSVRTCPKRVRAAVLL